MADLAKIKEIGLFHNIDEGLLKNLIPVLKEIQFSDGQVIFREDEEGDEIYFVFSGEIEIVKSAGPGQGEARTISVLGRGDFFGEMVLFDKKRRSAMARSKGSTTVFQLRYRDFYHFLKTDTQVAISIMGAMLFTAINRLREMDLGYVTVYETGLLLAEERSIPKLLEAVLKKILGVVPDAQRGFAALWNEFSGVFEIQAAVGFPAGEVALGKDDAVIKWLKENKRSLAVHDTMAAFLAAKDFFPGYVGRSFIAEPLIHRDEFLGFLLIGNPVKSMNLIHSRMNLLSGIVFQIAPVIANAKKIVEEENRRRLELARMRRADLS